VLRQSVGDRYGDTKADYSAAQHLRRFTRDFKKPRTELHTTDAKEFGMINDPISCVQDLGRFRLPPNFRGRSAIVVQLWWIVQAALFRCSPQFLYGWRRWLLRLFGATIGRGALIRPTAEITYPWKLRVGANSWVGDHVTLYTLGSIDIGDNVVVSQQTYICAAAHDYTSPCFDIFASPVKIEDEAWVATDCFIAPGVTIGKGCVIGARSSVFQDMPSMMVCFGTPARPVRGRETENELRSTSAAPPAVDV
jgi:putative colanic acid biosynthesis acetyltransferase WcaF